MPLEILYIFIERLAKCLITCFMYFISSWHSFPKYVLCKLPSQFAVFSIKHKLAKRYFNIVVLFLFFTLFLKLDCKQRKYQFVFLRKCEEKIIELSVFYVQVQRNWFLEIDQKVIKMNNFFKMLQTRLLQDYLAAKITGALSRVRTTIDLLFFFSKTQLCFQNMAQLL